MTAPDAATPAGRCRALLARAENAESFGIAEWLAPAADGRTVKDAYAEAARLAWELDKRLGGPEADAPVESPPGTQPKERERRPVLVLTRELRECLARIASRLGGPNAVASDRVVASLDAIGALLDAPRAAGAA